MRQRQGSVLETLRRVQGFLVQNDALLAGINTSATRKALDGSIVQLTSHAVDQDAGLVASRGETGRQQALRTALRQTHMKPIAAVAQAKLRDVPEFLSLQMPDPRISTPRLIAHAGAMAEAADKHAQVFVDSGLPQDFAAQLLAAADALTVSVDGRAKSRGRRVGATSGLKTEEKRGRTLVKVLDALVVPALGTNDHLVAEWKSLKRVSLKPGVSPGTTASTPSTTSAAGSTAPAGTPTTHPEQPPTPATVGPTVAPAPSATPPTLPAA